eukprot:scaffold5506_cov159-Amphora_coffeaeformis.AAC.12
MKFSLGVLALTASVSEAYYFPNCAESSSTGFTAYTRTCYNETHVAYWEYQCTENRLTGDVGFPETATTACQTENPYFVECGLGRPVCASTPGAFLVCPTPNVATEPLPCTIAVNYSVNTHFPLDEFSSDARNEICRNGARTQFAPSPEMCTDFARPGETYYSVCDGVQICSNENLECPALHPPFLGPNCAEASVDYTYYIETCFDDMTVQATFGKCVGGQLIEPEYYLETCQSYGGFDYCNSCGNGRIVCAQESHPAVCSALYESDGATSVQPVCPLTAGDLIQAGYPFGDIVSLGYTTLSYPCLDPSISRTDYTWQMENCPGNAARLSTEVGFRANCAERTPEMPFCYHCPGPDGLRYDMCVADDTVECSTLGLPGYPDIPPSSAPSPTPSSAPTRVPNMEAPTEVPGAACKTFYFKAVVAVLMARLFYLAF